MVIQPGDIVASKDGEEWQVDEIEPHVVATFLHVSRGNLKRIVYAADVELVSRAETITPPSEDMPDLERHSQ